MFCRNPCNYFQQNQHSKISQTHSLPHTLKTEPAGEQNKERGGTEQRGKPAGHFQTDGEVSFSTCSERDTGERPKPPPRSRRSGANHQPPDGASSESHRNRDHPWLELIQPGPWAKLPPAPAPAPPPHPASIPSLSQLWLRRWSTPSNPFEEEKEEDEGPKNAEIFKACLMRSSQSRCEARQLASSNDKSVTTTVTFPEMSSFDTPSVVDDEVCGLSSLSLNDSEASSLSGDVSGADSELPKLGEFISTNVCKVSRTSTCLSTYDSGVLRSHGGLSDDHCEDFKPDEGLMANLVAAAAGSSEDLCATHQNNFIQTSDLLDAPLCTLNENCLEGSSRKLFSAQTECSEADACSVADCSDAANIAQACSHCAVSGLAENASLLGLPNLAPETYDPAETNLDSVSQCLGGGSRPDLAASERLKSNQAQQHRVPQHSPELANASSNHKPCVTTSPISSHLPANGVHKGSTLHQTSSGEDRSSALSSLSSLSSSLSQPVQTKKSCKENPFNREARPTDSFSYRCTTSPSSTLASIRGPGYPLIKKKVEADANLLVEEMQRQQGVLEKKMQELEKTGEELEKRIQDASGKQEEKLLADWFTIIHEKHMLVRRDTELVYMFKQQELEQKQADVEFELRSLFNKPEQEWTQDDEVREQKLTFELVAIIEQRDDIISSQEKDRQREQEEDDVLNAVIRKRDFHRQFKPHLFRFGGKLKPLRVMKTLKVLKARASNRKEKRSSSISLS